MSPLCQYFTSLPLVLPPVVQETAVYLWHLYGPGRAGYHSSVSKYRGSGFMGSASSYGAMKNDTACDVCLDLVHVRPSPQPTVNTNICCPLSV